MVKKLIKHLHNNKKKAIKKAVEKHKDMTMDSKTGLLLNTKTGQYYDPQTGQPITNQREARFGTLLTSGSQPAYGSGLGINTFEAQQLYLRAMEEKERDKKQNEEYKKKQKEAEEQQKQIKKENDALGPEVVKAVADVEKDQKELDGIYEHLRQLNLKPGTPEFVAESAKYALDDKKSLLKAHKEVMNKILHLKDQTEETAEALRLKGATQQDIVNQMQGAVSDNVLFKEVAHQQEKVQAAQQEATKSLDTISDLELKAKIAKDPRYNTFHQMRLNAEAMKDQLATEAAQASKLASGEMNVKDYKPAIPVKTSIADKLQHGTESIMNTVLAIPKGFFSSLHSALKAGGEAVGGDIKETTEGAGGLVKEGAVNTWNAVKTVFNDTPGMIENADKALDNLELFKHKHRQEYNAIVDTGEKAINLATKGVVGTGKFIGNVYQHVRHPFGGGSTTDSTATTNGGTNTVFPKHTDPGFQPSQKAQPTPTAEEEADPKEEREIFNQEYTWYHPATTEQHRRMVEWLKRHPNEANAAQKQIPQDEDDYHWLVQHDVVNTVSKFGGAIKDHMTDDAFLSKAQNAAKLASQSDDPVLKGAGTIGNTFLGGLRFIFGGKKMDTGSSDSNTGSSTTSTTSTTSQAPPQAPPPQPQEPPDRKITDFFSPIAPHKDDDDS